MRNICKSVLLVATLVATLIPGRLYAQASTEGKEFWVATTIICQPPTASKAAVPYIAVSAKNACTISIYDYKGDLLSQASVAAGSWTEFGNSNNANTGANASADAGPINYYLDPTVWYPTTNVISANDVYKHADKTNNYGLHITATENVSVFAIVRAVNSMDASNILPVTAIQSEYYTQDYWPNAKDVSNSVSMVTILAIEDNTIIDITPKGNTYNKSNDGRTFQISLNKGQTYYLISTVEQQLAGTHIMARDGRKIAVFNGCPLTRIPVGISARDGMFEQSMPVDYWGTQFIVTRSMHKDGNIIGVTASQQGTEVKIDGYTRAYINEGETYYFMLQSQYNPNSKKPGDKPLPANSVFIADAAFIETSCPCAVYSYDTGNAFVYDNDNNENLETGDNRLGDPSSVWISPIQQKISNITFGACYTSETKTHYLNIVTETKSKDETKLTAYYQNSPIDRTSTITWNLVDGNTAYSYARIPLSSDAEDMRVFTVSNPKGFIGHVYGNGNDESYAYSVGSAAVEQGVNLNGETFVNNYRSETKFCVGDDFLFDAKVGTDEISRVDWDFGDGISEINGSPQTTHQYNVPGWYDVSASLYGHQVCTEEADQFLGSLTFSFRVVRPDTQYVYVHRCLDPIDTDAAGTIPGNTNNNSEVIPNDTIPQRGVADCGDRVDTIVIWGRSTVFNDEVRAKDSYYEPLNGITYPQNPDNEQEYDQTIELNLTELFGTKNADDCDTIIRRHIIITTCLDMNIPNDSATQHICPGGSLDVPYTFKRGTIGDSYVMINGQRTVVDVANGIVTLPVEDLKPGLYKPVVYVQDPNCGQTLEFPLDLAVYYPSDIFKYKYNNVLAVYKNGYGGNTGYDFTGYQWYRNGQAIEGATESVYHDPNPFTAGDEYYVVLTDKNGASLPSCPQTIENVPDFTPQENGAPAKVLINQRMYIILDNQMYDMFGQKVK